MSDRVLIFGGAGMLGHKLWQLFRGRFDTWVTVRAEPARYARFELFEPDRLLGGVDVRAIDNVVRAMETVRPDVVVNAVGIIKQRPAAEDATISMAVNALFPHRLGALCRAFRARLVHISTDCVFSGRKDRYTEGDVPDADDLYGRSKLLGEVTGDGGVVLRTSMIGRELEMGYGLVEWFLSQRHGRVRGFTNAIFSGFPTIVLAQLIADLIDYHPHLTGLYHVSSEPISKYELLTLLQAAYGLSVEIEPFPEVRVDRSLDSTRFRSATGFKPGPWPELVEMMVRDPTPYVQWRQAYAS